ncbi:MAG: phage holin family protein [Hymenobacteraceae bacterium]|nr:phage holin family protein [Hymenobacteraceae bacterium]
MAFFDKSPDDPPRPSLTGRLVDDVTEYIDTRLSLARLDAQASARNTLVGVLHGVTMAVLAMIGTLFLLVFLALALNSALDSPYWGFGIVAGVFLLLTLLFVFGVDKGAFTALAEKVLHNKIYKSEIEQERPAQL